MTEVKQDSQRHQRVDSVVTDMMWESMMGWGRFKLLDLKNGVCLWSWWGW